MREYPNLDGAARLTHLGVIRARGADAASFLQGQLTNDVAGLGADAVRLAGFCSAKGRLQASFQVWRPQPEEILLACSADLLAATLKRLSMFVLRARCSLDDASAEFPLHGLAGAAAAAQIDGLRPWQRRAAQPALLCRLPDAGATPRALWIGAPPPDAAALTTEQWRWLDLGSGIPTIEAATVDAFVPQMINFELVGAVDFRKGCYPGQEVVARSQYRGTLKRRTFLFEVDAAARAGAEIFAGGDPDQPAGRVANAAAAPFGGSRVLAEVKLAALAGGAGLHLGAADGPRLLQTALPYEVPGESEAPVA